jgi:hypothetical protein
MPVIFCPHFGLALPQRNILHPAQFGKDLVHPSYRVAGAVVSEIRAATKAGRDSDTGAGPAWSVMSLALHGAIATSAAHTFVPSHPVGALVGGVFRMPSHSMQ